MSDGGRIAGEFMRSQADGHAVLDRARVCSSLTKPWILPPEGHVQGSRLPEPYSSLCARGVSNLEGRLLIALFPPGLPFFRLRPAARYRNDPSVDPELLRMFDDRLFLNELVIQSKLESNQHSRRTHVRRSGFRSRMRSALSQVIVTGDALLEITDSYTFVLHRRDCYVTRRDTAGDVLYHVTRQTIDPMTLSPDQAAAAGIDHEQCEAKPVHERMEDMYTMVSWQPRGKRWLVEQEVRGRVIVEGVETVSPFLSIPYELPPGEHYGRGLIEQNLGDVRSLNELTERILDFAGLASKHLFAIDYSSQVMPEDLAQETGRIFQARVQGGQIQDVATLRSDKLTDFNIVGATREAVRKDLASVMLMEAESTPRGERVTAYQVERVAMELEGALGGVYAPLADSCQVPLIERLVHMCSRDGLLSAMPDEAVEVEAITGIAALSRESDNARLVGLLGTIAQLGPQAMERVNVGNLIDLMMRQVGIMEPGLIKSDEQVMQERQAAMQQQVAATATAEGAKAAGGVIQSAAEAAMSNSR